MPSNVFSPLLGITVPDWGSRCCEDSRGVIHIKGTVPFKNRTSSQRGILSELALDKATKDKIKSYVVQESAENSSSERARKIVTSIPSTYTPVRITDVPYIQKKHRKLSKDIFKRPSIGSAANCKACHQGAEQGIYEDDDVVIPAR